MTDIIINLKEQLRTKGESINLISGYLVGSYVDNSNTNYSDIDLLLIGDRDNKISEIMELRKLLVDFFTKYLYQRFIIFTEPAYERLYFKEKYSDDKILIHIIYHPIDRFNEYIKNNDYFLLCWKDKNIHLFGKDLLNDSPISIDSIDFKKQCIETLNLIIQLIQNIFITGYVYDEPLYYLKTYYYCLKLLLLLDKMSEQLKYKILSNDLRIFIVNELKKDSALLNETEKILNGIRYIESEVFIIKTILEK